MGCKPTVNRRISASPSTHPAAMRDGAEWAGLRRRNISSATELGGVSSGVKRLRRSTTPAAGHLSLRLHYLSTNQVESGGIQGTGGDTGLGPDLAISLGLTTKVAHRRCFSRLA